MTSVGLASSQLVELARQMIGGTGVHVPRRIHRIRRSEPRILCSESSLFLIAFPIVPNAKEVAFEAAMAARRQVPLDAAELDTQRHHRMTHSAAACDQPSEEVEPTNGVDCPRTAAPSAWHHGHPREVQRSQKGPLCRRRRSGEQLGVVRC